MQDQINQFISYFSGEIRKVMALDNELHQKVLYITILDALSKARYPKKLPADKMKTFVRKYGDWADKDKVSLIQLQLNLNSTLLTQEMKESSQLLLYTRQQIATWKKEQHVYDSSVDPVFDKVSKMIIYPEEKTAIMKARYCELFYTYRNKLIHEFRKPGYAIERKEYTSAFYFSYINAPWELGFPVGLFENLCCSCLINLKQYLYDNNKDPYEYYQFGSMWSERDHLNLI